MNIDTNLYLSQSSVEALPDVCGPWFGCMLPDGDLAFRIEVLKMLDDREEWFPRGKWATIQVMEAAVAGEAKRRAEKLNREMPHG